MLKSLLIYEHGWYVIFRKPFTEINHVTNQVSRLTFKFAAYFSNVNLKITRYRLLFIIHQTSKNCSIELVIKIIPK